LEHPLTVVSDDGETLATMLEDGCPFTFPEHPFGPHPWAGVPAWSGPTLLQLRRDGDWYSVWKFFDGAVFRHWYVNFEQPVVRRFDGIDTDDHQLDLVIEPDGTTRWKDVEDLGPCVSSGRMSVAQVLAALDAAAEVADRLARDDRWWAPWDDWTPHR
jgi:hypothetical protein